MLLWKAHLPLPKVFHFALVFRAKSAAPAHIYDLRLGKYLGHSDRIAMRLDPWQPSLFALFPQRIPGEDALAALTKLADAAQ